MGTPELETLWGKVISFQILLFYKIPDMVFKFPHEILLILKLAS